VDVVTGDDGDGGGGICETLALLGDAGDLDVHEIFDGHLGEVGGAGGGRPASVRCSALEGIEGHLGGGERGGVGGSLGEGLRGCRTGECHRKIDGEPANKLPVKCAGLLQHSASKSAR
jgi:hypothetical protein